MENLIDSCQIHVNSDVWCSFYIMPSMMDHPGYALRVLKFKDQFNLFNKAETQMQWMIAVIKHLLFLTESSNVFLNTWLCFEWTIWQFIIL